MTGATVFRGRLFESSPLEAEKCKPVRHGGLCMVNGFGRVMLYLMQVIKSSVAMDAGRQVLFMVTVMYVDNLIVGSTARCSC